MSASRVINDYTMTVKPSTRISDSKVEELDADGCKLFNLLKLNIELTR